MTRILVVDDEPTIRQVIAEILQDEGFEVVTAVCGQQMLEHLGSFQPALILLDMMMPGLSGLAALEQLRVQPKLSDIPVVLMSAGMWEPQSREPLQAFLSKPFEIFELLNVVNRMTGPAAS